MRSIVSAVSWSSETTELGIVQDAVVELVIWIVEVLGGVEGGEDSSLLLL